MFLFILWIACALSIIAVCGIFIIFKRSPNKENARENFSGYEQLSIELFQGLERLSRSVEHLNIQTLKEVHEGLSQVHIEHHKNLENYQHQLQSPLSALTQQLQSLQKWHQQIDQLSHKVYQLTRVLDHSTLKGKFGERQLEILLRDRYPHSWILSQYVLSSGVRADCVFRPQDNELALVIDSKFPVQSFKLVLEHDDHPTYFKDFIAVMKKNISEIAQKYIISGVTHPHAVLFVPSDALFFKLLDSSELMLFAQQKNVLLCCPQSLYWICDLIKEHYFHNRWTHAQGQYIAFLKSGREKMGEVLSLFDQWDRRCTQLRQEGRHLKKELISLKDFFDGLEDIENISMNIKSYDAKSPRTDDLNHIVHTEEC